MRKTFEPWVENFISNMEKEQVIEDLVQFNDLSDFPSSSHEYADLTSTMQDDGPTCSVCATSLIAHRILVNNTHLHAFRNTTTSTLVENFLKDIVIDKKCPNIPEHIKATYTRLYELDEESSFISGIYFAIGGSTMKSFSKEDYEKFWTYFEEVKNRRRSVPFLIALFNVYGLNVYVRRLKNIRDLTETSELEGFSQNEIVLRRCFMNLEWTLIGLANYLKNNFWPGLHAVLIDVELKMDSSEQNCAHAIAAFPSGNDFLYCNSWGASCSSINDMIPHVKDSKVYEFTFVFTGLDSNPATVHGDLQHLPSPNKNEEGWFDPLKFLVEKF